MEKYAHDATMMHSEQVRAKARKLGRPLSSFRERDMSLNEAQPSVLVPPDACPAFPSPVPPASLSINAPHRVHSIFTDRLDDAEAFFSVMEPADDDDDDEERSDVTGAPSPHNPPAPTPAAAPADARPGGGTGRIQWREGVHVREYVPSPRVTGADSPGGWHSPRGASPRDAAAAAAPEEECVSRRASNLSARAGTVDELLGSGPGKEHNDDGDNSGGDNSGTSSDSGGVTRRASGRAMGAGAFDELMASCDGGAPPASSALVDTPAESTGGGSVSRRASNMSARAGTFEELMADAEGPAGPRRGRPAALSLGGDSGGAPSRCASNMAARAGTFSELLDAAGGGGAPEDTDAPSDVESPAALRGAVSRRAANMADASGAFDALVDDDGDELPDEECSEPDAAGPFASPFGAPDASFAGMLSDVDVGRAAAGTKIPSPPARRGGGGSGAAGSRARTAVARLHATGDLIDLRGSWQSIGGSLPSDVAAEVEERDAENPVHDAPPGPSAASSLETLQMGGNTGHVSLRLGETETTNPLFATASGAAAPPSRAASLARIRTPRGALHVPTDFAVVSVPPSANPTPSASRATSLSAQLSIRTPCKSLGTFEPPAPVATGRAPLAAALSDAVSLGGALSVRTPRKVYGKVCGDGGNAPPVDTAAMSSGWLQKMVSLKYDSAASVLQPSEWAAGLVERGASVGAKQRGGGMDASGNLGATMFAAFRPGMDLL